ncbi:conserved membrane hypothetical protein [Tenacibaculum litoreum]|uniref:hypothetical protein n=1 Tax=Tenacibaculum TaxID=104267 RepID=UPI003893A1A0
MIQITYTLYLVISIVIVLYVGNYCFQNGKIYIRSYFPHKQELANGINNILLVAYYCLNIGLAVWSLASINKIMSIEEVVVELCSRVSFILIIIGILHFSNLYMVSVLHKKLKQKSHDYGYKNKLEKY